MIEIIPAIMPKDFADLEEKMGLVRGLVPLVQIDVMDGTLTIDPTLPYLLPEKDVMFSRIVAETESMPFWEELDFEVDLLVKNPQKMASDWIKAGAKRLIFHVESDGDLLPFIQNLPNPPKESPLHIEIGIAINTKTPQDTIRPFLDHVDFVQCMGIDNIGNQGEPFNSDVLKTIAFLRDMYPKLIISVDGGVGFETAPMLIKAGVNRLVSGSAVFKHTNPKKAVEELKKIGEGFV